MDPRGHGQASRRPPHASRNHQSLPTPPSLSSSQPSLQDLRRRRAEYYSAAPSSTYHDEAVDAHKAPLPSLAKLEFTSSSTANVPSLARPSHASRDAPNARSENHAERRAEQGLAHEDAAIPDSTSLVECLVCVEKFPVARRIKLDCGHTWCVDCLKRPFDMSLTDRKLMPPRCCREEAIPFEFVEPFFSSEFQQTWKLKYEEYTDDSPVYCPRATCPVQHIQAKWTQSVAGVTSRECPKCKTSVCVQCKTAHKSGRCPGDGDPEGTMVRDMAKEKGWQTCYHCKAIVERVSGCNHMTCVCRAEFCAKCGTAWNRDTRTPSCSCPVFDPDQANNVEGFMHFFAPPGGPLLPFPPEQINQPYPRHNWWHDELGPLGFGAVDLAYVGRNAMAPHRAYMQRIMFGGARERRRPHDNAGPAPPHMAAARNDAQRHQEQNDAALAVQLQAELDMGVADTGHGLPVPLPEGLPRLSRAVQDHDAHITVDFDDLFGGQLPEAGLEPRFWQGHGARAHPIAYNYETAPLFADNTAPLLAAQRERTRDWIESSDNDRRLMPRSSLEVPRRHRRHDPLRDSHHRNKHSRRNITRAPDAIRPRRGESPPGRHPWEPHSDRSITRGHDVIPPDHDNPVPDRRAWDNIHGDITSGASLEGERVSPAAPPLGRPPFGRPPFHHETEAASVLTDMQSRTLSRPLPPTMQPYLDRRQRRDRRREERH